MRANSLGILEVGEEVGIETQSVAFASALIQIVTDLQQDEKDLAKLWIVLDPNHCLTQRLKIGIQS